MQKKKKEQKKKQLESCQIPERHVMFNKNKFEYGTCV